MWPFFVYALWFVHVSEFGWSCCKSGFIYMHVHAKVYTSVQAFVVRLAVDRGCVLSLHLRKGVSQRLTTLRCVSSGLASALPVLLRFRLLIWTSSFPST